MWAAICLKRALVILYIIIHGYTHVVIIPDFGQPSEPSIRTVRASFRRVESRARAANIRNSTMPRGERVSNVRVAVLCLITWLDTGLLEPLVCWHSLIILDRCLKEVHDLFMLFVLWTIARSAEGRVASGVL